MKKKTKKTPKPKRLSHLPSAFIREALDDLRACERRKDFTIDMNRWYTTNGKCSVCLGGAAMANRLGVTKEFILDKGEELSASNGTFELSPNSSDISKKAKAQVSSLDEFRKGSVGFALSDLRINKSYSESKYRYDNGIKFDRDIIEYLTDPKQFHKEMHQLARDLEKGGY